MPSWFQPTSAALIASCGVVFALVLGWALFWVPSHRPDGGKAIAQQLMALLLTVVVSMLMAGLLINRRNDWYPSWASLRGTVSGPVTVTTVGGSPMRPVARTRHWVTMAVTQRLADPRTNPVFAGQTLLDPAPTGNYLKVSLTGPVSKVTTDVLVWLPASYLSHPQRHYPVILAFPGFPGSVEQYRRSLPMDTIITNLAAQHRLREAIVVALDVFPGNQDTECVDASDGSILMDTFVNTDVVSWVKTNLRVIDAPGGWATLGFSAGGWCASMLALRHPHTFGYAMNMSGYFQLHFDGPLLRPPGDPVYDLSRIAADAAPDVRLWFWSAKDDRTSMRSWQQFSPSIRHPTALTTALVEAGGHSWPVWTAGIAVGLPWLAMNSPDFAWVAG